VGGFDKKGMETPEETLWCRFHWVVGTNGSHHPLRSPSSSHSHSGASQRGIWQLVALFRWRQTH